jgi:hypothetical protein
MEVSIALQRDAFFRDPIELADQIHRHMHRLTRQRP